MKLTLQQFRDVLAKLPDKPLPYTRQVHIPVTAKLPQEYIPQADSYAALPVPEVITFRWTGRDWELDSPTTISVVNY